MDKALQPDCSKADKEFRDLQTKIKMTQKSLGMKDEEYKAHLLKLTGKDSTTKLDICERRLVWAFFNGLRNEPKRRFPGRPLDRYMDDSIKGPMLRKVEAMLAEAKRQWAYAHGIAKHMFSVDRLEFCRPDQLHKIVQAMMIDARRHGRRTA